MYFSGLFLSAVFYGSSSEMRWMGLQVPQSVKWPLQHRRCSPAWALPVELGLILCASRHCSVVVFKWRFWNGTGMNKFNIHFSALDWLASKHVPIYINQLHSQKMVELPTICCWCLFFLFIMILWRRWLMLETNLQRLLGHGNGLVQLRYSLF